MTKIPLTALATAALICGPALAQSAAVVTDSDGNGSYSMGELKAAYPDLTAKVFAKVDANADGAVSPGELAAATADGTLKPSNG